MLNSVPVFPNIKRSSRLGHATRSMKALAIIAAVVVVAICGVYGLNGSPAPISKIFAGLSAFAAGADSSEPRDDRPARLVTSGGLLSARSGHTATRLADGNVLIVGGDGAGTAEIFDSASTRSAFTGNLVVPRSEHTATLLSDGKVLIAGGSNGGSPTSSTEIYDPETREFSIGPEMTSARSGHTATVLVNGTVLLTGGGSDSAEIFDGAAFAAVSGVMTTSRSGHSAILMSDGRALIVGGTNLDGEELNSAEIYDPATGEFSATGNAMAHTRSRAVLRMLPDGKVQIIGGNDDASIEIYDPSIDTIGAHAHMIPVNDEHGKLLPDDISATASRAALFHHGRTDAAFDREQHTITELGDQALVAGGTNTDGRALDSFGVYESSNATVTTDKLDYQPGQTAIISGTGWQPGEIVDIVLHEDPHTVTERRTTAEADNDGNFTANYLVEERDLNVTFIIGAKGQTSARTAQTTFTDASSLQGWRNLAGTWSSVNLTSSNSTYTEGNTIPFRFVETGLTAGTVHTVLLKYDFTNGATGRIIDSLGSYDRTVSPTNDCTSPASCTHNLNASTWTIPTDGSLPAGAQIAGVIKTYNISNVTFSAYSTSGIEKRITLTYTVAGSSGTRVPVILFGAHLARENEWGTGNGASTASGASTKVSSNSDGASSDDSVGINPNAIVKQADLSITKSDSPDPILAGDTLTYTLVVSNNGPNQATSVTVTDSLPASVTFVSCAATNGGTCGGAGNNRTITYATLNAGASSTITLVTTSSSTLAAGSTISNTATVAATTPPDPVSANNTATATTTVKRNTTTSVSSSLNPSVFGNLVTFTATVTGTGTGTGNPTNGGTVEFFDGATSLGTQPLSSGSAAISTAALTVGAHSITAVYSGDSSFNGSTSSALSQVVNPACTAPAVTLNPVSQTVTYGTPSVSFTSTASGDPAPTILWEVSTNGGGTWSSTGVTTTTLTLTTPTVGMSGNQYRAVFTNTCGGSATATSNAAILTVNQKTVSGSFTVSNKVYDGNTSATILTRTINPLDIVGSDVVTLVGGTATFDTKNVGNGKTVTGTGFTLGGAQAANYVLGTVATTTADITPKNLTINGAVANNKIYDGTTAATVNFAGATLVGVIAPDVVTINSSGYAATFDTKNVGTAKPVTVTGVALSGADSGNYTVSQPSGPTADITPKALTLVGALGVSRVYNGLTNATVNFGGASLSGVIAPDVVGFDTSGYAASFNNKNVGTAKPVTVTGVVLNGGDAGNYSLAQPTGLTADITQLHITGSFTAASRVYDGTTNASVLTRSLTGTIVGDDISLTGGTASFADENVGVAKTVTLTSATLAGADAANYFLDSVATTTADITARTLNVTTTGIDKIYDATTAASVSLSDDRVSGDVLTLSYTSATFADKHVGNAKPINVTGISITGGADAGNYVLGNTTAVASANITPRALVVTAIGVNKTYDGTTAATVTLSDNRIAGDVFTASYTSATFTDKNVGTGKTINVTGISLSGVDAGNYSPNTTANATADITPLALTCEVTVDNKVYDGTTGATINGRTLSGVIAPDVVSCVGGTAAFVDKNVGTGKTVNVTGLSLFGADAGNYTVNTTDTATADITALHITGSFTAAGIVYDGTTDASVLTRSLSGTIAGDDVSLVGGTASFADKHVGVGKVVTLTGATLFGADAGNYILDSVATTTADIMQRPISVTADNNSKTYGDADPALTYQVTSGSLASGDVFTGNVSRVAGQNFGPYAINQGSLAISDGNSGNNYAFTFTAATFTINKRPITITADNKVKVYGSSDPPLTYMITSGSLAFSDTFTGALTRAAGENVGNYAITQGSLAILDGNGGANYTFTFNNGNLEITALTVAVTPNAGQSKVYGSGDPTFTYGFAPALAFSDAFSGSLARDAGETVGLYDITQGSLSLSSNYNLVFVSGVKFEITRKELTASIIADDKIYDGTTAATFTCSLAGVVGTDNVSCSGGTATFANANVGTWLVTATGLGITGSDAGNYTVNSVATDTADITPLGLTINGAVAQNKIYDGGTAAMVHFSGATLATPIAGDDVSINSSGYSASFSDKNVGNGKPVTVTGVMLAGAQAGNYTVSQPTGLTADITPKTITATVDANDKTYDATTAATINSCIFAGTIMGDDIDCVTTGYTASFTDANAGMNKPVSVTGLSKSGGDAGNYSFDGTGTDTADITPATPTVVVTGGTFTYDGAAHPATAVANGIGGTVTGTFAFVYTPPGDATEPVTAGTYGVMANFTSGDSNYTNASGVGSITINKAATTTTVTCPASVVYSGAAQTPCSAVVMGAGGLNQVLSVSYLNNTNAGTATASAEYTETANYLGSSDAKYLTIEKAATVTTVSCPTNVTYNGFAQEPCSATVTGPSLNQVLAVTYMNNVNAGVATASASYAETANYLASSDDETFTVDKAATTTTVTCPSNVTYTGAAQTPCSAAVTGPALSQSLTVSYMDNVNAGTATASASYAETANYLASSDVEYFTIDRADSVTTVTCPASVVYTGAAQTPCTVSVTGAGGLNLAPSPSYSNNVNAGTASASYTYAGDANHNGSSDSENFTIDPAASVTTITCPVSVVYNGAAQTPCTVSIIGAGGLNLTPTPTYANNTNAGTATASYTYAGDANHIGSSDSENFDITKAPTTTTVTCPTNLTYTGAAQTPCSASVTGAGGLNLSLTVIYTNNINAGTANASASYAETANYQASGDSENFTIDPALSTTVVTFEAGPYVYRASAFTATAQVTGAGGLSAPVAVVYSGDCTNVTVANGCTATATFAGDANHTGSMDAKSITVTPRGLTITAVTNTKTYDANTSAASVPTVSGLQGGDSVTGLTETYDNRHVGTGKTLSVATYIVNDGNGGNNYAVSTVNNTTGVINQASLDIAAVANSKIYDANTSAAATPNVTGLQGSDTVTGLSETYDNRHVGMGKTLSVATYTVNDGNGGGNYAVATQTNANGVITKAPLTITALTNTKVFDNNTTAAAVPTVGGLKGSDSVTGMSETYDTQFVGTGKTLSVASYTVNDGNSGNNYMVSTFANTTGVITTANTVTSIMVSPTSVQYSDAVTFTANVAAVNPALNGLLSGSVQFRINGANFGSPVALTVSGSGGTAALTFNNALAPNTYNISAVFTSTNMNLTGSTSGNTPLTITREDARLDYTGMLFVNTTCATCGNATVQLSATVKDITAAIGDPAFDANEGNISNATLTFVNRDTNTDIATVPISLVSPSDTKVGTAVYNWSVNIGSADSLDYTVGFRVNGHYTRDASTDNVVVTVSKPIGTNFITGGGYLVMTNPTSSAGQYAGAAGLKTNFGFNVKYNNSGKNLQGRVNVIVRGANGRVYQIKGNQMDTLTVNNSNPNARTAIYTGKCNLTDITDPLNPISISGGNSFQMKLTDKGEPGNTDTIGVTVYANGSGALLFSSRWNGTTTIEQILGGGNLVVR